MALITNSSLGQISGRIGGLVYTRNGGINSVRQYVKGTDARSLQQLTSRQRFSVMAAHWRTLSQSDRSAWKLFAQNVFVAKHPKPTSKYSGYESFVSLNTTLATFYSSDYGGVISDPNVIASYSPFNPVNYVPPSSIFTPSIQDSSGSPISFLLSSATYNSSTNLFTFTLNMCPGGQILAPIFKTPFVNTNIGFSCYFSNPFSGGRTTTNSKEAYLIGNVLYPVIDSGWATSSTLTFQMTVPDIYLSSLKYSFNLGSHIFVTIYAVGSTGQTAYIGRLLITIS